MLRTIWSPIAADIASTTIASTPLNQQVFQTSVPGFRVGDVKLSHFAAKLADAGIDAQFLNGVLVCCDGKVMMRKSAAGDGASPLPTPPH